jgi:hypothetical protein
MKHTMAVVVISFALTPLAAQQDAPVVAQPPAQPAPRPEPRTQTPPGTLTYFSNRPSITYSIEPVSANQVRVAGWEAAGFKITINEERTAISSNGEAILPAGRIRVERVALGFADGRGYLTLVRPSQ